VLYRLGPASQAALGWAASLPALFPECDWSTTELAFYRAKFTLPELLSISGRATVACTDPVVTGDGAGTVTIDVDLRVRRSDPSPPPPT
jgi:hypothetical protein